MTAQDLLQHLRRSLEVGFPSWGPNFEFGMDGWWMVESEPSLELVDEPSGMLIVVLMC